MKRKPAFSSTYKKFKKGLTVKWLILTFMAIGAVLPLVSATSVTATPFAAGRTVAIPEPTPPLDGDQAAELLENVKASLADSDLDESVIESISNKWDAQILTNKTQKQAFDLLFAVLKSVVKDQAILNAVWASWAEFGAGQQPSDPVRPTKPVPATPPSVPQKPVPPEPGPTFTRVGGERKNRFGMELVWIKPGFSMIGSNETEVAEATAECVKFDKTCKPYRFEDELPKKQLTVANGFWMGKFEVTQAQWMAVMATDNNPSYFYGCATCPVEMVSWDDAQSFIERLNAQDRELEYRLPSEALWEYAARGGKATAFGFGPRLDSTQANFNGNYPYEPGSKSPVLTRLLGGIGPKNPGKTKPVGSYRANDWGLYDMHGNVMEWVQDTYAVLPRQTVAGSPATVVGESPVVNGPDPTLRVMRGGCWRLLGFNLRSAFRLEAPRTAKNECIGFRVIARER